MPLAHPEQAAIVSSPRIFNDLTAPAQHGEAQVDVEANAKEVADAKAQRRFRRDDSRTRASCSRRASSTPLLDSVVKARGGTGAPQLGRQRRAARRAPRHASPAMIGPPPANPNAGPTQCHDITVYPAIGLAGGACEGYGLLLDIRDPAHPVRIAAVADSNFSYWHSATFNNDGTKVLFCDEWGGGGQPKCRATDKHEWGADAHLHDRRTTRCSSRATTRCRRRRRKFENCVAHNGSLDADPGTRRDGPGLVPGRHLGLRLDRRRSIRRRSRSSIAARSTRRAWRAAARGRCTGTTA